MALFTLTQIPTTGVVLYTRRECHLCETALRSLQQHGLTPLCIDIDEDPALKKQFDSCVPVVEIGGRIRFRGAIHPVLLRRIILRGLKKE